MSGHVRKRGAVWYAVFDVRDVETGKRKRKWQRLEAKGKREAQAECDGLHVARKSGTYQAPAKITLADFLEQWLEHQRTQVAPRSYERYAEIARKNVVPLLGAVRLTELQPAQISAAYAKALKSGRRNGKGGLSARTVGHMHRVLKQALSQAVRWNRLTRNPAADVKPPKVGRSPMTTYDATQAADVIAAMRPTRMFVPTLLAVLCGLRRGEIAALRWRHVKLDAAQIEVVQSAEQTRAGVRLKEPKSGRGRSVALSAVMVRELKAHRIAQAQELLRVGVRLSDETFVVAQADGTPVRPNGLTLQWKRKLGATTLPRARFHDMRHSHATLMLTAGVHPKVASERLGHSKVGITLDLYSHVMPGMQEGAAALVDDALEQAIQRRAKAVG